MLTTVHQGTKQDSGKREHGSDNTVNKPDAVVNYIIIMWLINKLDTMIGTIDCLRQSFRW